MRIDAFGAELEATPDELLVDKTTVLNFCTAAIHLGTALGTGIILDCIPHHPAPDSYMGFTLFPLDESIEPLDVNYWNWRPTVQLIGSFELIDDERLELMKIDCCGAEVNADEAGIIADRIEADVLANLPNDGRVTLDLSVATVPDDFKFHTGDEVAKNYSATANWLKKFVVFCRASGGFSVI